MIISNEKIELSEQDFLNEFENYEGDKFSLKAKKSLYKFLLNLSNQTKKEIVLNLFLLCSNWTEDTKSNIIKSYFSDSHPKIIWQYVIDNYFVVNVSGNKYMIAAN